MNRAQRIAQNVALALALAAVAEVAYGAWYSATRPPLSFSHFATVRFDADDKSAHVILNGEDRGPVPHVVFLNRDYAHRVEIGNHVNGDYHPPARGERYYVACDGTKLD